MYEETTNEESRINEEEGEEGTFEKINNLASVDDSRLQQVESLVEMLSQKLNHLALENESLKVQMGEVTEKNQQLAEEVAAIKQQTV